METAPPAAADSVVEIDCSTSAFGRVVAGLLFLGVYFFLVPMAVVNAIERRDVDPVSWFWAVLIVGGLTMLIRAFFIRRIVAGPAGLFIHDGLRPHHLGWEDVDGFVQPFLDPEEWEYLHSGRRVFVLHHGRYMDELPMPSLSAPKRAEPSAVCEALTRARSLALGAPDAAPCPVRIIGGLPWRRRWDVVELRGRRKTDWIIHRPIREDYPGQFLRRKKRWRREAQEAWARRVAELDPAS